MAKCSLVIMAAGLGSRYGGGVKQLAQVGQSGEIIMDYSIHDAVKAGFDKLVFILRRDIEEDFKAIIGNRIEEFAKKNNVEVCYAFQDKNDLPQGFTLPEGRVKPWGTGHAVFSARQYIKEPFLVINADDYYGVESYKNIFNYLTTNTTKKYDFCMAGFILKNTLSDNGSVNRGICTWDKNNNLTSITETHDIVKEGNKAISNGVELNVETFCSMNMWGLTADYMDYLEKDFIKFLSNMKNPLKDEYYIHAGVDSLIKAGEATCNILKTNDVWLGVTYAEDKQFVVDSMKELINKGVYKNPLFSDFE